MENKESCANRICEGLAAKDMTQADLCRLTGSPKSTMSQYCNGGLVPRQDRTFLIASALNVSEAWLMGFDVPMERKTTPASLVEDGRMKDFVDLFGKLTAEQQTLVHSSFSKIGSCRQHIDYTTQ